jgi:hypothetical protein
MAVGKRHARRLTYENQHFRWRCDFHEPLDKFSEAYARHGTSWTPDALLIRPEEQAHRLLTVLWPACAAPMITPRVVRVCIEEALRRGWLQDQVRVVLAGHDVSF